MKRSLISILSIVVLLGLLLQACTPTPTAAPQTTGPEVVKTDPPVVTDAPAPTGPVNIAFWHAMSGHNGEVVDELVKRFNESQSDIIVTATFQGSYDDEINKLKAGFQSKDVPAVVQVYDIGTRLMIDLGVMTPMQDFIDAENFDVADIEPNVANYYSVDGKMWSMPFNTSNPVLYYNKDMFEAAGLDPEKAPQTWAEVEEAARAIKAHDPATYGCSFAIYGWFFEQFMAVQGGYYVDNDNGRTATATKAVFNGPEGVALLNWWKGMIDEGICSNLGRKTTDTKAAFDSGVVAMTLDSTAGLRDRINAAEGKFEVGVGYLPRAKAEDYGKAGTIIGGASVWITNLRPVEEQQAAWEFVKFLSSAESQAYWHIQTGYYPINSKGYNEPDDVAWRAQYPQFEVAMDQLHIAPLNNVTAGGLIGVFPEARQTVEAAIEEFFAGQATAQEALNKAAASITTAIEDYNLSIGK
jgi:sn-glycerol 3-phosphate transport system substrate-binding protein